MFTVTPMKPNNALILSYWPLRHRPFVRAMLRAAIEAERARRRRAVLYQVEQAGYSRKVP